MEADEWSVIGGEGGPSGGIFISVTQLEWYTGTLNYKWA